MRVLLWSPKGAGLHYGGPGMSAFRLYASRESDEMQVDLAHGFRGQPPHPEVFERTHLVAPIFRMEDSQAVHEPMPTPLLFLRFIRSARQWLRSYADQYDVFHGLTGYAYSVEPALEAERAGLPAVIKLAAHQRDLVEKTRLDRISGRIRRRRNALQSISAIIAISHSIREEVIGYGLPESKVVYIPNGVNADRFTPACDETRAEARALLGVEDRFTVLFAGSLVARKGPHVAVAALAEARRMGADAQLLLAGPCEETDYVRGLRAQVHDLGLESHVRWLGMITEMPTVYRAADVFCLPSDTEGLSNAVLEALASGLPVLAMPVSGNVDLIDGGNGRLLDGDGPSGFAAAMYDYYSDPALLRRHGDAARRTVLGRLDARTVLAAHEELFRRILQGGDPAGASL